ncbi:predicted protein [Micromonas commoda]|uniref:Uncharacterized protein n=1 Tax=Micromonas commoda (strain RCC299 / NOUM17 / CCMP2709) TaxID=296587 RepID=C1ECB1_MICCC|nr:predicted protein [Micromonas commoda]ACO65871.1 predicted protein [Micromonas commoda]|eukprot:XP_002504613.1 predicted protein [Micromonas commoda]
MPSAPVAAIASRVAPRRLRRRLSAESTPSARAPTRTAPEATPVNAVATARAFNATNAARACVPRGRSRSAFVLDLSRTVTAPVRPALPIREAAPHAPTDS